MTPNLIKGTKLACVTITILLEVAKMKDFANLPMTILS